MRLLVMTEGKPFGAKDAASTNFIYGVAMKNSLYGNIHAKQERIKAQKEAGKPVEKMRKVGSEGAPTKQAFIDSAKTAKPMKKK
jgi:hypothetical protein